jgi:hypothetical protein
VSWRVFAFVVTTEPIELLAMWFKGTVVDVCVLDQYAQRGEGQSNLVTDCLVGFIVVRAFQLKEHDFASGQKASFLDRPHIICPSDLGREVWHPLDQSGAFFRALRTYP